MLRCGPVKNESTKARRAATESHIRDLFTGLEAWRIGPEQRYSAAQQWDVGVDRTVMLSRQAIAEAAGGRVRNHIANYWCDDVKPRSNRFSSERLPRMRIRPQPICNDDGSSNIWQRALWPIRAGARTLALQNPVQQLDQRTGCALVTPCHVVSGSLEGDEGEWPDLCACAM